MAVACEPMVMQPVIAPQNRTGNWLYNQLRCHRISHVFSSATKILLRWRRDLPLKHLSSQIRTSCSDQLADSVIPCGYSVRSKKALLEEQISAQRCCKCRAIIVRRVGIPYTLMTLMLSVCHAWGNARTASVSVLPLCARG